MSFRKHHLRYFVTVAEEGQITRAARKLSLAQPALSQALSQLEAELGLKLLERHARGVRLTSEGRAFLEKARAVVDSEHDVRLTAQSLARAARAVLEIGFVGPPPQMTLPLLFSTFATRHPEVEVSFRDLPFPKGTTRSWLDPVDVAICHPPLLEDGVRAQALRSEPRAMVLHRGHPLAARQSAPATELLDETYIGYDESVQAEWVGFHNLDDVRGARPAQQTSDRITTSLQMLGVMGGSRGVTTVPRCDAELALNVLPGAVAVAIDGAAPAVVSLVWCAERENALVEGLVAVARSLVGEG